MLYRFALLIFSLRTDAVSRSKRKAQVASCTEEITSLSYSFGLHVKAGYSYFAIFFGNDPSLALVHYVKHIEQMTTVHKGEVIVTLVTPREMELDKILAGVETAIGKHQQFLDMSDLVAKNDLRPSPNRSSKL